MLKRYEGILFLTSSEYSDALYHPWVNDVEVVGKSSAGGKSGNGDFWIHIKVLQICNEHSANNRFG